MKKYFLAIIILILTSPAFGAPIIDSLYENIKEQALASLGGTFNRQIKIGEANGRVVGQIVLKDVYIGDDLYFSRFIINFNPISYAYHRGDIMPSITEIKTEGGWARVSRDKSGKLNLADILKTGEGGGPPFKAKFSFEKLKVLYSDAAGMPYKQRSIKTEILNASGTADLKKYPKIALFAKANSVENGPIDIKGSLDAKKATYDITILARKLKASTFGSYFTPFFDFKEGLADASVVIKTNEIKINVDGTFDGVLVNAKGRVFDRLDLSISLKNANISQLKNILPSVKDLDIAGISNSEIKISGPYSNIKVAAKIIVDNGAFSQIKFAGRSNIVYENNKISVTDSNIKAYGGNIDVSGGINLNSKVPEFNLSGKYAGLDISEFVNKTPGLVGKINGDYVANGDIRNFKTELVGIFTKASVFGQPIKEFGGSVQFDNGKLLFDKVKFSSDSSGFSGFGEMSPQRYFSLHAKAEGLKLRGGGVVGPMGIVVDKFLGDLSFKLDEKFLSSPLKNLTASGSVEIKDGFVGLQKIESGSGIIQLENGKINVKNMTLKEGKSLIQLSGVIGIGVDTQLKIIGEKVELSDLKILNNIFQADSLYLNGAVNIALSASGRINKLQSVEDLEGLVLSAEVQGVNIRVGNNFIKEVSIEASFAEKQISFDSLYIKTIRSELTGYYKKNQARLLGNLDLDDAKFFLSQYGDFSGWGKIDYWQAGDQLSLTSNLTLDLFSPKFNKISIDRIYGSLGIRQGRLSISKPLNIISGNNKLVVSGYSDLDFEEPLKSKLKLKANLSKGDIKELLQIGFAIKNEIDRILKPVLENRVKLKFPSFYAPTIKSLTLYTKNGDSPYYFKKWDQMNNELATYKKAQEPFVFKGIGGEMAAQAEIGGILSSPNAAIEINIKGGELNRYNFEKLDASIFVSTEALSIEKCEIKKQAGKISVFGDLDFTTQNANFKLFAKDMPIDVLTLVVDKEFKGRFDASGKIMGPISDPSYAVNFKTQNIELAGVGFDKAMGMLSYYPKKFIFNGIKLYNGSDISSINGNILLDGDFELEATLEGKSLGLLNLFNQEIKWLNGKSSGTVQMTKKKNNIVFFGNLLANDLLMHIEKTDADIGQGQINISFEGNAINVNQATGYWYGKQGNPSPLSISGYFDTKNNSFEFRSFDGKYYVDIPELYRGDVSFGDLAIYSGGMFPTISGRVGLSDGLLYLPNVSPAGETSVEGQKIGLNIELNIPKNVYLTAGNLNTINLSNIFMNLEMVGEKIQITGDTLHPSIFGKIFFKRGTINIFNREFLLLSPTAQKEIFPYNTEKISDNFAEFSENLMPRLDLKAKVIVEDVYSNTESARVDEPVRKNVLIVSHLQGIPQGTEKDKTLSIYFDAFDEDKSTAPPSYRVSSYSEDQIKVLLLPDFIKSAMGINRGTELDSNAVVADYLNSRIQTFVFRGIERELEKTLGLESLTLEYNFGRDLRRALGARDVSQAQAPMLGVGFVKGLFDRFYISVKYSQLLEDVPTQDDQTYINYQLTYRLTSVVSISYYREPISINDIISGYYKTTLNAQYAF